MKKSMQITSIIFLFFSCHKENSNLEEIDIYSKMIVSKMKSNELKSEKINDKTCGGNTSIYYDKNNLVFIYNSNGGDDFETQDFFFVKNNKILKVERSISLDQNHKRILYYTTKEEVTSNSLPENKFGYSDKQTLDCGNQILQQYKK